MFRVLLTAYVSLVLLAGPSACCCTTARALAGVFAGPSERADAGHGRPSCCCGHHGPRDDAAKDSAAGDGHGCPSAPGEKHECPCRKDKAHVVAEAREQVADLQQFRSLVPLPLDLPAVGAVVVDATVRCPDAQVWNRASHFGSAREILRVLRTYLI